MEDKYIRSIQRHHLANLRTRLCLVVYDIENAQRMLKNQMNRDHLDYVEDVETDLSAIVGHIEDACRSIDRLMDEIKPEFIQ